MTGERNIVDELLSTGQISEDAVSFADDYLTAIVGTTEDGRLVYEYGKMVQFLVDRDGMTEEEAAEFIDYNAIRSLSYMSSYKIPVIIYGIESN